MSKRKTRHVPVVIETRELIPVHRSKGKGRGKRVKFVPKCSQREGRSPISQS